jgi:hypothetical protein
MKELAAVSMDGSRRRAIYAGPLSCLLALSMPALSLLWMAPADALSMQAIYAGLLSCLLSLSMQALPHTRLSVCLYAGRTHDWRSWREAFETKLVSW